MTARFDPLRLWLNRWGRIIFGLWLTTVSISLIVIALGIRSDNRRDNLASAVQCWRTMTLGPYTVADAKARHLYPAPLLVWAEAAIPKHCPEIPDALKPPTTNP